MKLVWCMMNWLMRAVPKKEEEKAEADQKQEEGQAETKTEKEAVATAAGSAGQVKEEAKHEAGGEVKQESVDVKMENA